MANQLVFPDGIRLANKDEIPGPNQLKEEIWQRIQLAKIEPGYVLTKSDDKRFAYYAEANIDAPDLWLIFCDLCRALLGLDSVLLMSTIEEEPIPFGRARTESILAALSEHEYQFANDGWIQFGLMDDSKGSVSEVFVAPTKHLKVWLNDEHLFRSILAHHGLNESDELQFIDQYPRVTIRLREDRIEFPEHDTLVDHFKKLIADLHTRD